MTVITWSVPLLLQGIVFLVISVTGGEKVHTTIMMTLEL